MPLNALTEAGLRGPVGAAFPPRLGADRVEDGAPMAVDGLTIKVALFP
jgi:hypothetical protein